MACIHQLRTIIEYFLNDQLRPCVDIHLPLVLEEYRVIYAFVILYNYAILIGVLFTIFVLDSLLYFIFINIPLMSTIIIEQLNELQIFLEETDDYSPKVVKFRLMQIIMMHKKFNE